VVTRNKDFKIVIASADASEVTLRLVGAFYAFGGYIATRAALTGHVIDRAIAAIGGNEPPRAERLQGLWMLCSAFVVLAGGVMLVLLLTASAWVFLASAIGQAAYLFWLAPRYFDAAEAPDPIGRRQTANAFATYSAATAFVFWASITGRLQSITQVPWQVLAAAAIAVIGYCGYAVWQFTRLVPSARV
jgi:hypothetical protein